MDIIEESDVPLIYANGNTPLRNDTHIRAIDQALKIEHWLDAMIAKLPISLEERVALGEAFYDFNLWPVWFRSDDPQAKRPLVHDAEWREDDNRALLFVEKFLPGLDLDEVGAIVFPNRETTGPYSTEAQYFRLLEDGVVGWEKADNDALKQLFQVGGEKFPEWPRTEFEGRFTAFELELAVTIAI
jgi:hypothetical protein